MWGSGGKRRDEAGITGIWKVLEVIEMQLGSVFSRRAISLFSLKNCI